MKKYKYKELKDQYDAYQEVAKVAMKKVQADKMGQEILDNYQSVLDLIYHLEYKLEMISELSGEVDGD